MQKHKELWDLVLMKERGDALIMATTCETVTGTDADHGND